MRSAPGFVPPVLCWAALALAIAVIVFRFSTATPIDTDIQSVLPRQANVGAVDVAIQQSSTALSGRVAFLVRAPDSEIANSAAADLEARLSQAALYQSTVLEAEETARWIFANRDELLCVPPATFDVQAASQTRRQALAQVYSVTGAVNSDLLRADPFLRTLQLADCLSPQQPMAAAADQVLVSGRLLQSAYQLDVQTRITELLTTFSDEWSDRGVTIARTGSVFFAAAAAQQARADVTRIAALGAIGMLGLFAFAFLRLRAALAALGVVGFGLTVGIGATFLVFTSVNVLVFVFAAMLVGIASDYAIHALATGPATNWADAATRRRLLMRPTSVSLVTTVLGFAALALFGIPLLQQVAVMAGAGLFAAWAFVLVVVVPWDTAPAKPEHKASHWNRLAKLRANTRLPPFVLAPAALALFVLSAYGATNLTFVDDVRTFQTRPADLLADEAALGETGVEPTTGAFLYSEAETPDQARLAEAAALRSLPDGVGALALSGFDPPAQTRVETRAALQAQLYDPLLAVHLDQLGLQATTGLPAPVDPATPRPSWFAQLEGQANGRAFLAAPITTGASSLHAGPAAQVIDPITRYTQAFAAYRGYAAWALLAAVAGAALVVLGVYRRARALVIVACPTLALLAAVLAPAAFGMPVNFFTLAAGLVLLGVGLDYAAFEWEAGMTGDRWTSLAVLMDSITTFLSMGLLALSATIPVQSFGLTIAIGVIAALSLSGLARIAGRARTS